MQKTSWSDRNVLDHYNHTKIAREEEFRRIVQNFGGSAGVRRAFGHIGEGWAQRVSTDVPFRT